MKSIEYSNLIEGSRDLESETLKSALHRFLKSINFGRGFRNLGIPHVAIADSVEWLYVQANLLAIIFDT
jgi:hypothetical protein